MPLSSNTVLLDANVLLLLVIGSMDIQMIGKFKRTSSFTVKDYEVLLTIVEKAGAVMTTPHILTETSNLANSLRDDQKQEFSHFFALVISSLREEYIDAELLSRHPLFKFGIADVSMLHTEANLILTEDGRFAAFINHDGNSVALDMKSATALQGSLA